MAWKYNDAAKGLPNSFAWWHSSTSITQIYLHISSYRGRQAFKQYSKDIMEAT